ncbi:metallophosphoesterase [Bradyrhizobium lablabi]|uniref:metallophosphoesterase n=1 Tax=Bradyrhizobium lablabi TaxID=722472 RepID=UPI001BA4AE53|nr:metallophosphoesterase [Bradyrhizobium lablabi]MBR1122092.1 metallophosphoesterase [Bradyrhizobium lablabi]
MVAAACTDREFLETVRRYGVAQAAKIIGTTTRNVNYRRRRLEKKLNQPVTVPQNIPLQYPGRVSLEIRNGSVLIGSDFHIWPGEASTCLRAFKKFVEDLKPSAVILNGDVMDFPRISRHPQNWESAPDPQEEIEAAQDHLNDIVSRCKRGARKLWTLGNHDARFEQMIANAAPQYRGIKGVHLSDHFGCWTKAMSCFINESIEGGATMVKHRWKSGQGATRANTLNAGVSMVTGHLHSQNVRPLSDYRRFDRYGVDTGCVADKEHRAFSYTEDSALDWRSGFALLTYRDGILMPPELITKMDAKTVWFRGALIRV